MKIFIERFLIPLLAFFIGNGLLLANPMEISWPIRIIGILFVSGLAALFAIFSGKYDELRQRQYPLLSRIMLNARRRVMSLFQIWPFIGMATGALLFVGCVVWQLVVNDRANAQIQETLSRYVLPRHLSEQQVTTIAGYLSKYPPQQYRFTLAENNAEVGAYSDDIQRALSQGGWTLTSVNPTKYSDDVREGIAIMYTRLHRICSVPPIQNIPSQSKFCEMHSS